MRKSFKQNIYMLVIAAILASTVFATPKKDGFSVDIAITSGIVVYVVFVWIGLLERWIKLHKRIKTVGNRFEKDGMDCTYIFNDDGIAYEDKEKSMKLSWQLFKPFEAYKDNIYIKAKDTGAIVFHLSRQELGDSDYQEVYALLENKIG